MSTIAEIENAVATLSPAEKYELYRFLAGQLQSVPKDDMLPKGHGVLDIPAIRLSPLLREWTEADDRLGDMLEGRS